jgi:spore maturation protein CgeB
MRPETVVLLTPFEDCCDHPVLKRLWYVRLSLPVDICFNQPLQRIFSKVIVYDYLKRLVEVGFDGLNQEIVELVKRERPSYVLWVAYGDYYEVLEATFDVIREEGAKIIGWFLDDEVRFDYYSKWWIPRLDYFVTNDPEAVRKYREIGAWATQATCTGLPVTRDWKEKETYDISFVGSIRADRGNYMTTLRERNIPVDIFGLASGRFVSYDEMLRIFGMSKVNLNFSRTYDGLRLGIKARVFEVCLAGGFLLTEYVPSIENFFEIGKEIDCFRDKEEMVEKIRYYLGHDAERRAIAHAGWERACNQYSASHVVARVFAEIELAKPMLQSRNIAELSMPLAVRKRVARYYNAVANAFLQENYTGFWKDAFRLSMSYHSSTRVRLYATIGSLPLLLRMPTVKIALKIERGCRILYLKLLIALGRVPYLRRIKRFVFSKRIA